MKCKDFFAVGCRNLLQGGKSDAIRKKFPKIEDRVKILMKCKDFFAVGCRNLLQGRKSDAIRKILLYILNLLADFFKLPLHVNNNTGNLRIVALGAYGIGFAVKLLHKEV